MKFRKTVAAGVVALIAGASLAACAGSTDQGGTDGGATADAIEPRTLVQSAYIGQKSIPGIQETWWMDEVTKRTDGAITFDTNWASSLCSGTEQIPCISDGRSDIGLVAPQFAPSNFPLSTIDGIPFQVERASVFRSVWNRVVYELPQVIDEYAANNLKPLYVSGPDQYLLASTSAMSDISELNGKSVRAPGGVAPFLATLGMEPISLGSDEIYEAMQRGVINGAITDASTFESGKVNEVAPYFYTIGKQTGAFVSNPIVINLDTWNSLDPRVQDIMLEVSAELIANQADLIHDERVRACKAILATSEMGDLTDNSGWAKTQAPLALGKFVDNYKTTTGNDPSAFVAAYQKIIQEETAKAASTPESADNCTVAQ